MKELMRVLKESRWSYILFSIVLATIFWLFVRQTEDPVRTGTIRNIPVSVDGEQMLEAQGLTVRSVSHDTVSLRVSAPLSQFERMQDNMTITLDVSRCSAPGEYQLSYRLNYPSNVVVSDVTVNERLPLEITVVVEQLASKSLPSNPGWRAALPPATRRAAGPSARRLCSSAARPTRSARWTGWRRCSRALI